MASQANTIDRDDVARFERQAEHWWDADGPFKPLHQMNPVRLGYIRARVEAHFGANRQGTRPLKGLAVADIGCGGGLLSEPLARLGGAVTGIDASRTAIDAAGAHAKAMGLAIDYRCQSVEDLAKGRKRFDLVTALEIVEHVADVDAFLGALGAITRPGGLVVMSTLNRTLASLALAKIGAEYVLRLIEPGTHNWRQFIKPSELSAGLRRAGLVVDDIQGMLPDPMHGGWRLSRGRVAVNYILSAAKPAAA